MSVFDYQLLHYLQINVGQAINIYLFLNLIFSRSWTAAPLKKGRRRLTGRCPPQTLGNSTVAKKSLIFQFSKIVRTMSAMENKNVQGASRISRFLQSCKWQIYWTIQGIPVAKGPSLCSLCLTPVQNPHHSPVPTLHYLNFWTNKAIKKSSPILHGNL